MSSILSVSQLNSYLSLKIGGDLKLKSITIRGELSDFKIHYKSGNAFFTLKDSSSQLRGIMFSNSVDKLGFEPCSGMNVLCTGSIRVYEASGIYQIMATEMIPAGVGAMYMQLNAVKEKLEKQGLFAQERKKPLPPIPKKIAVVTSLSGAALHDVLNILRRRYPVGEVLIFPSHVQGDLAQNSLVDALGKADSSGADVIILTRGGGSFEELMPFNTEAVAVAVANCKTPVISAVGHETDTSLADYAADMRAPTPSAAAELCAPTVETMIAAVDAMQLKLTRAFEDTLKYRADLLKGLDARIRAASPNAKILNSIDKVGSLESRLRKSAEKLVFEKNAQLEKCMASLSALSPYNVLDRGYTITMKNGAAVTEASQLSENDEITIRFRDFAVTAKITAFTDI